MASSDKEIIFKQKEAVGILCKNGVNVYQTFLAKNDLIDFLNEEEKAYFKTLKGVPVVYSEDVETLDEECSVEAYHQYRDPEVCTSLEVDGPPLNFSATEASQTKIVFSGICKEIINNIKKSSSSIKIAMFMFTEPSILKEICNKKLSCPDISVHILVDESQFKEFMEMAKKLIKKEFKNEQIGINVKAITKSGKQAQGKRSGKAHEKFMIVDESHAITGSFNFTWASEHINYENVIISNDKKNIVKPLLSHFKKLTKMVDYEQL